VRYGIALPTGGECGDPRFVLELARLAEAAAWDGIFLEDYVWYQGDPSIATCNTWAALAAMAVATERVMLGVEVVALPRRRPWNVAREAAAIDQLSAGRLVVGFAAGDTGDPGFTHVAEPTADRTRAELLDEGLAIIAGLWSGEPFSFEGKHYTVREVTFAPRPLQEPRPQIWIGGGYPNPRAIERALRWDGSCLYMRDGGHLTAAAARDLRARAGARPFTIAAGGQPRRDDWDDEREQIGALADAGADWWVEWVPPGERGEMHAAVRRGPLRAG
jgi:alkanesulfonate monooxygenase SsuD/methylene tetrahydromethanopterin reductase-like flavin-dependent oxidoreductase (luciferase family)